MSVKEIHDLLIRFSEAQASLVLTKLFVSPSAATSAYAF